MPHRLPFLINILAAVALCSCGTTNVHNPSFPLSRSDAKSAIKEMTANPKKLRRPVVVLSGYLDPGIAANAIRSELLEVVVDTPVIASSFATNGNFDDARNTLITEIEAELPSSNPYETVEIDVIGHSMGGLVARYASLPGSDGKRLRIARLFTIATPHQGAVMAGGPLPINKLTIDMDEESEFIERMKKTDHPYPIIPYVMLGDQVVGQENTSPKDQNPWWVDRRWFQAPHLVITSDERILADIFRRLRDEEPFTIEPPTPLPDNSQDSMKD